jgi:hypothetical protein
MTVPHLTETSNRVYISTSLIPNANLGLFSSQTIPEDSFICHYNGIVNVLSPDQSPLRQGDTTWYSPFFHVLVVGSRSSFGSYANDPRHDPSLANADIRWNPTTRSAALWAITDIYPDEEILISYGSDFWRSPISASSSDS